jgi:hypothetical protein
MFINRKFMLGVLMFSGVCDGTATQLEQDFDAVEQSQGLSKPPTNTSLELLGVEVSPYTQIGGRWCGPCNGDWNRLGPIRVCCR